MYLCRRYVLQGSVLFGKNIFPGFIYIKYIAGFVVENYSKSLQEFEDGIIRVQLVIRVIFQERKCLRHLRKWLPCFPCGLLTLAKETGGRVASSKWMKHRECPRCFSSKKRAGGIHTDVLNIFSHAQNHSRYLQMDMRRSCCGKALLIWREHPYPLFGQKPACILRPARVEHVQQF